jgi:hypothetical protein
MPSQRQIEASRANGAKSRGPVTTLGKAISSRNSTQHGLSAQTVVLRNEDPALFQALLASNARIFGPEDDHELRTIHDLTVAQWRLYRAETIESVLYDHRMDNLPPQTLAEAPIDEATRTGLAFQSLADQGRALATLGQYESRYRRAAAKAIAEFYRHRNAKASQTKETH